MLDVTNCGLQICAHPTCWESQRQINRELSRQMQGKSRLKTKSRRASPVGSVFDEEELPTVSIVDLLKNAGYWPYLDRRRSTRRVYASSDDKSSSSHHMVSPSRVPSLRGLLPANEPSPGDGITPAPANTPLHSALGFGTTGDPYKYYSSVELAKRDENKVCVSPSVDEPVCHRVKLELPRGPPRVKTLVWIPPRNRTERKKPKGGPGGGDQVANVLLPVDEVPMYKSTASESRQHIRGKKTPWMSKPLTKGLVKRNAQDSRQATSSTTPIEIEQLRNVPIDILVQVLQRAADNNVLTLKQAKILLNQVKGRYHTPLPPISSPKVGEHGIMLKGVRNAMEYGMHGMHVVGKSSEESNLDVRNPAPNNSPRTSLVRMQRSRGSRSSDLSSPPVTQNNCCVSQKKIREDFTENCDFFFNNKIFFNMKKKFSPKFH